MFSAVKVLYHLLHIVEVPVTLQLESLAVDLAHVLGTPHQFEVLLQLEKLVVLPFVVGQHWHPVLDLVEIGEGRVVHQDHLGKVTVDYR